MEFLKGRRPSRGLLLGPKNNLIFLYWATLLHLRLKIMVSSIYIFRTAIYFEHAQFKSPKIPFLSVQRPGSGAVGSRERGREGQPVGQRDRSCLDSFSNASICTKHGLINNMEY